MNHTPPPIIADLVERFEQNLDAYRASGYNETQLRREFLDSFFEALGWDITNRDGHAEAYKDVIHEDAIKVGGVTKAPDYCFRIGGIRKFFLEAKRPAINIKEEMEPAYQLRRYAWSAKLPLSILTDFEEFAVYDCRARPNQNDKPATARILYLTYPEYLTRWGEIASVFSKEAILKGSFDKYAASERKRGTATVDAAFLDEIERWREALAKDLARRNPLLSVHELHFAVQRTIDRLVFLRICEDRGVEHYGRLLALRNGENVFGRLKQLFHQADDRYNSGLFHFRREAGRPTPPDELTLSLKVDDNVLKDIIRGLYYPESPYEFSVLPIEILGQVYEQFLGKVIRLTKGHQAKVEEKPEVRKAGGVYYTPVYIVEYIVRNTVGKLVGAALRGRPNEGTHKGVPLRGELTPKQISKIRILDPACGSGSFLIGAYDYLLSYHRDWYEKDGPDKHRKELYRGPGGQYRLTAQEKKRILLNNIYGVDIDPQAVEVTKLSLLLKVLEGETDETLRRQLSLFQERALPDLGGNIKCGNSLIGPDYFAGQLLPDEDAMRRVNPFDWKAEFPTIFPSPPGRGQGEGGFDAVIGNPPYVRIQTMREWAPLEVEAYKTLFVSASKGNYDIYVVFVEKGLSLLNKRGRLGYILPHKFFQAQYGESLRGLLARGRHLAEVVHFGDQQVFDGATTYTSLLFLDKAGADRCRFVKVHDLMAWRTGGEATDGAIPAATITNAAWNFAVGKGASLFEKLSKMPVKLGSIASIFVGLQTSADKVYVLKEIAKPEGKLIRLVDQSGIERSFERQVLRPFLNDITVTTFERPIPRHWLIFPYHVVAGKAILISAKEMSFIYPRAWKYLMEQAPILRAREGGKWNKEHYYAFGRTQNLTQMDSPKLIVQVISVEGRYAYDDDGIYFTGGGNGPYYGVRWSSLDNPHSLHYLQGLLNSKLLDSYLHRISSPFRGGYWSYGKRFIEQLPIRPINFSDKSDKAKHDQMIALVERMQDLHKRLAQAKSPDDKTRLQRQINATDREIDQLVYSLYGLTEKEITIVEDQK